MSAFRRLGVDLIFDVGANRGQYAGSMRRAGYSGRIVSLEPLPDAFAELQRRFVADQGWSGLNVAAGPAPGRAPFNVSSDSVCSSLLVPSPELLQSISTARTVAVIDIEVARLDDVWAAQGHGAAKPALKLDVQGFEREALAGAATLLKEVVALEIELALEPSYQGGYMIEQALPELVVMGFEIVSIGRGYSDPATGRLIDIDVLLEKSRQSGAVARS